MSKKVKMEANSFSSLVRAIDEKWAHTYEEFEQGMKAKELEIYIPSRTALSA